MDTLREVRPTSFLGVPRVWEKMHERMKEVGAKASGFQKKVVDWAKAKGTLASRSEMDGWVKALFILAFRLRDTSTLTRFFLILVS